MSDYTIPTTRTLGELIEPDDWNTDVVENIKYLKGTLGDIEGVTGLLGAYNGRSTASGYAIGLVYSPDGNLFFKHPGNPVIRVGASGTWDDDHVKDPYLVAAHGSRLYMYYSGSPDGSQYDIGLAISADGGLTWTKYSGNPVLSRGSAGQWDDVGVSFPTVMFDPDEADATKRFKMWYTGGGTAAHEAVGYATSPDGLTWTKFASNPVVPRGSAGTYDDSACVSGEIVKHSGTYYLFYAGVPSTADPNLGQVCLATFSNPESVYTKHANNPLVSPRTNASQVLTANANAGDRTLTVGDTSVFATGESVIVSNGAGTTTEFARVIRKNSSTVLTLLDPLVNSYTTAASSFVRGLAWGSIGVRGIGYRNGKWVLHGVAIQAVPGVLREAAIALVADDLTGPWTYDHSRGRLIEHGAGSAWDSTSAENVISISYPNSFAFANPKSVSCRVHRTTNQAINDATSTLVVWESKASPGFDSHGFWSSGSRVTVPKGLGGYYHITWGCRISAGGNVGARFAALLKNGTVTLASAGIGDSNLNGTNVVYQILGSAIENLADGDFVEISAFQNSGGALNIVGAYDTVFFSLVRIAT